jgi:ADP-ribose pyrophosphatase YjhB (NUDIX family)
MTELPLAVVISVLVKDNKILLIKRLKGDYMGLLGLPGGKVEKNEHLSEAAVREIVEESGIEASFKSHLGFVSEHLMEGGNVIQHFLLHVCELEPKTTEITKNQEGNLAWFGMEDMNSLENQIIPSDFMIIDKFIRNKGKTYYNSLIEKVGEAHILKKFE